MKSNFFIFFKKKFIYKFRIPGDLPSQFNQQFNLNKQKQLDEQQQQQLEINSIDGSSSKLNEDSYQSDDSLVNTSINNSLDRQSNNLNAYTDNTSSSTAQNVLDAFHYAVSDLAVGGRCKIIFNY